MLKVKKTPDGGSAPVAVLPLYTIDKLERIQKNYTSKIRGLENMNYHERLEKLNLNSLERRRERFMIINAWEQIEGIRENILK